MVQKFDLIESDNIILLCCFNTLSNFQKENNGLLLVYNIFTGKELQQISYGVN
jgi:hypothetical protein